MTVTAIPVRTMLDSINILLTEAYAGPPDPRSTWFIDNEPDSGIFGILKGVSAEEASQSMDKSGNPGSTIAANVEHLRWSLANMNAAMRGEPFGNWKESWQVIQSDTAAWEHLRDGLHSEFETLHEQLSLQTELPDVYITEGYLTGVIALVPHAAFHLGILRQMIERVKSR